MSEPTPTSSRGLRRRLRLFEARVAMPCTALVLVYFGAAGDLWAGQWPRLLMAVTAYGLLAAAASEVLRHRLLAPLERYLDRAEDDERVAQEAFRAVIALPRRLLELGAGTWLGGMLGVPFFFWLFGHDASALAARLPIFVVASGIGALTSSAFTFFGAKRMLSDVCQDLAERLTDPSRRAQLVRRTSLAHKIRAVVVGSVGTALLLSLSLARTESRSAVDALALDWQERTLLALQQRLGDRDLDSLLGEFFPQRALLAYPAKFALAAPSALESRVDDPIAAELKAAMERGATSGRMSGMQFSSVVAWRLLPGRGVLISKIPRTALRATRWASTWLLLLVVGVCFGVAIGVAWLLSSDVRVAVCTLAAEAQRMAQGDLSRGRVWESDDELGDLGRAFESMGSGLRGTTQRAAAAADRLEEVANGMAGVAQGVAVASVDQVRRIQQANELMAQIAGQVADVSRVAQDLNVSIEESGSSILELGAAGNELDDTASVLSERVDDVSGSIEQVVASVKQVGATSEHVSAAAAETAASMEEMASAMRAVDTTAEQAAGLSGEVVRLAETGQQKVSQTIEGMQAISEATEAAEQVVRSLGVRAGEIGGILDVIEDVADETNLLALNAAIIAAQAGDDGRAFSVVADEIKELADRTLASTKEIGRLIRSVQEESANAVGAIETGASSVASGVDLSAEAGAALEEITRASRDSGLHIAEIVEAVRQQTKATAHVVGLMEGVRTGVEQISEAGGEQARGSEVVVQAAGVMQDVAKQVRHTAEEQAHGFDRIRRSVEGVREAVESINRSLGEQTDTCARVASFLEQVAERTRSNEEGARHMGESMRELLAQAEALRESIAQIRL